MEMPPKGTITKKRRTGLVIYARAVEENPGATQEVIHGWVADRARHWALTFKWDVPEFSRGKEYIREIASSRKWLDTPWHIGIFAQHDAHHLAPNGHALQDVTAIALRVFAGGLRVSARQAHWLGIIQPLLGPLRTDSDIADAYAFALEYSALERGSEALSRVGGAEQSIVVETNNVVTWSLDVMVNMKGFQPGLNFNLMDKLGYTNVIEGSPFKEGDRTWLAGSDEVKPLYYLLLEVEPRLAERWNWMTAALLHLRATSNWDFETRTRAVSAWGLNQVEDFITREREHTKDETFGSEKPWGSLTAAEQADVACKLAARVMNSSKEDMEDIYD